MKKVFGNVLFVLIPFAIGFAITIGCSHATSSTPDSSKNPPAGCVEDSDCPSGYKGLGKAFR